MLESCADEDLERLLRSFARDPRMGVRALASARRARLRREQAEIDRLVSLAAKQRELHEAGHAVVVGVDEVGRGCLAGPVSAAAVILDVDVLIEGLNDSKKLLPHKREEVAALVIERATVWNVAHATSEEIDVLGIGPATRLAWERAVFGLRTPVDHVLLDGNDARIPFPGTAVIGGDAKCACIAAASVVAKVTRDALMVQLDATHPGYGLAVNKGYSTSEHLEAIRRLGPSPVHRRSFAPCAQPPLF